MMSIDALSSSASSPLYFGWIIMVSLFVSYTLTRFVNAYNDKTKKNIIQTSISATRSSNTNHDDDEKKKSIPWAPGGKTPLLGHALEYKKDPVGFILNSYSKVGSIFQLNLAGKYMIVICGGHNDDYQRQVASASESILSAKQAVMNIGFEQTLGRKNVMKGTNIHKGIIVGYQKQQQQQRNKISEQKKNDNYNENIIDGNNDITNNKKDEWIETIELSFEIEIEEAIQQKKKKRKSKWNIRKRLHDDDKDVVVAEMDFFHLIRKVLLRTTIGLMISPIFLKDDDNNNNKNNNNNWMYHDNCSSSSLSFLDDFMEFQDALEEATAKAAVLPRSIALPFILLPVQRHRLKLQKQIVKRLKYLFYNNTNNNNKNMGFWLSVLYDKKHDVEDIAEYIIGLLFAAHKNPAIGAAQTYLLLHERTSIDIQTICYEEAREILLVGASSSIGKKNNMMLRRLMLESLRLTAHTIGGVRTALKDFQLVIPNENENEEKNCKKNDHEKNSKKNDSYYVIPKGSTVALSHISTNLNPKFWKNPHSIDMTLSTKDSNNNNNNEEEKTAITTTTQKDELYQNDYIFTTFSHGIHKCPGQQLAYRMIECTVAILLNMTYDTNDDDSNIDSKNNKYQIILPTNIPPLSFERATLAQREGPIMIQIIEKKNKKKR